MVATIMIGLMEPIGARKSITGVEIAGEPPIDDKLMSKRDSPLGNRARAKLVDCDEEVLSGFLEEHGHTLVQPSRCT